ncbi:MAG: hypothetical protein ACKPB8_01195, partial [Alphaproteobacteria bacterium]
RRREHPDLPLQTPLFEFRMISVDAAKRVVNPSRLAGNCELAQSDAVTSKIASLSWMLRAV